MLWNSDLKEQSITANQSQLGRVSDEKSGIQETLDSTLEKLDSLKSFNDELLITLQKKSPKNSIIRKLTEPQQRMLRLIDSTNLLRDSINKIESQIVNILSTPKLDRDQANNLKTTFVILGDMALNLNFALDNQRLQLLRDNALSLKVLVGSFDKKMDKLDRFSKQLDRFSTYLGVAIDIFTAAVSQGIIVPASAKQ